MATTTDIARLSGFSRTTISAVLNDKGHVREETRQKVLACIRENGLEHGLVAKSLVSELANVVAVLAPNLSNPFYGSLYEGVDSSLTKSGFHVLFYKVRHEDEEDPYALELVKAYHPRGYIIPGGAEGKAGASLRTLLENKSAVVTIDSIPDIETNAVIFNNRNASRRIVDYVLAKGHRNIMYLAGPRRSSGAKERQLGFVESVVEHELAVHDRNIVEAGESAEEGYRTALAVLSNKDVRPTVLICFNDLVAIGVYRAAHELGLHIPDDISVTGFDGIELGEVLGPPLTTLSIHPARLGVAAAELLVELLSSSPPKEPVLREVDVELVERASVKTLSTRQV